MAFTPSRQPLPLPASPADSGFSPRREFAASNRPHNNYALLTFSQTSSIRLAAFPDSVVLAFRKFLDDKRLIRLFRENKEEDIVEFTLAAKFWANPKATETERLLVQCISLLNSLGYTFVTSIDYGREPGDKLTLSFSRPLGVSPTIQQSVFALSFNSTTALRVINPPLQATPGILQAVRSSWPRGIVSENKASNNCWEFKLKGYSFFDEDTFQADSQQTILTLLKTLDKHGFNLLSSISLTNSRSRTKDLWIFSTSDIDTESPVNLTSASATNFTAGSLPGSRQGSDEKGPDGKTNLNRISRGIPPSPVSISNHIRSASVDQNVSPAFTPSHSRNASTPATSTQRTVSVLKKSPRPNPTLLPPVADDSPAPSPPPYYTHKAISKSTPPKIPTPPTRTGPPPQVLYTTSAPTDEFHSEALLYTTFQSDQNLSDDTTASNPDMIIQQSSDTTPPLLSSKAFRDTFTSSRDRETVVRDSAFSSMSGGSFDVPVVWTGGLQSTKEVDERRLFNRTSNGPAVPGGWVEEQSAPVEAHTTETSLEKQVNAAHSPHVVGDSQWRRSHAASVQLAGTPSGKSTPSQTERKSGDPTFQRGWVLVNVSTSPTTEFPPVVPGSPISRESGASTVTNAPPLQHKVPQESTRTTETLTESPKPKKKGSAASFDSAAKPLLPHRGKGSLRRLFSKRTAGGEELTKAVEKAKK